MEYFVVISEKIIYINKIHSSIYFFWKYIILFNPIEGKYGLYATWAHPGSNILHDTILFISR